MTRTFLDSCKYTLVNGTGNAVGGPGTREDPANNKHKSALDLVIVSSELLKYVEVLDIDKDRRFTPFGRSKKGSISFPDHYAVQIVFKNIPKSSLISKPAKRHVRWNTNKSDGWTTYRNLTTNNKTLEMIASNPGNDPNVI